MQLVRKAREAWKSHTKGPRAVSRSNEVSSITQGAWHRIVRGIARCLQDLGVFVFGCCRMTKFDIKNYFERIYNVKVLKVNTRIQLGMRLWRGALDVCCRVIKRLNHGNRIH